MKLYLIFSSLLSYVFQSIVFSQSSYFLEKGKAFLHFCSNRNMNKWLAQLELRCANNFVQSIKKLKQGSGTAL